MIVLFEWLAFLLLIGLIWVPASRVIRGALDGHTEKVRGELEEAKRLREEAQSMLAEQQRRLASGEDQARSIVEHARAEAKRQTERHREELEASLRRRTELAQARIAQEEGRAIQELRAYTATLAVRTTERLLADQVGAEQQAAFVDQAIQQVGRKLA